MQKQSLTLNQFSILCLEQWFLTFIASWHPSISAWDLGAPHGQTLSLNLAGALQGWQGQDLTPQCPDSSTPLVCT